MLTTRMIRTNIIEQIRVALLRKRSFAALLFLEAALPSPPPTASETLAFLPDWKRIIAMRAMLHAISTIVNTIIRGFILKRTCV